MTDIADHLPPVVPASAEAEPATSSVSSVEQAPVQDPAPEGPPSHALWRDGAVELVYPGGYSEAALTPLPAGFFDHDWVPDPATRTFNLDWTAFDAMLHARIDEEAGEYRRRVITIAPGQPQTYQLKEIDARAWTAAAAPMLADHPFVASEVEATGLSGDVAAASIISAADRSALSLATIEGARRAAKIAVSAATTRASKIEASHVDWAVVAALL